VDKSDLLTIVFDIFSKRKQFTYYLTERVRLYLGFLGKACKILRCRICKLTELIRTNKMFERAKEQLDKDCDIIEMMDQARKSKNFQRNFLSHRQKILLKFDNGNVIREVESGSDDEN